MAQSHRTYYTWDGTVQPTLTVSAADFSCMVSYSKRPTTGPARPVMNAWVSEWLTCVVPRVAQSISAHSSLICVSSALPIQAGFDVSSALEQAPNPGWFGATPGTYRKDLFSLCVGARAVIPIWALGSCGCIVVFAVTVNALGSVSAD